MNPDEHVMCRCCGEVWPAAGEEPRHRTPASIRCPGQGTGNTTRPAGMAWDQYVQAATTTYATCHACGRSVRVNAAGELAWHQRELPLEGRQRKPRTERCPGTKTRPLGSDL